MDAMKILWKLNDGETVVISWGIIHYFLKFDTMEEFWSSCMYPEHMLWVHKHSDNYAPEKYAELEDNWSKAEHIFSAINKIFDSIEPEIGKDKVIFTRYKFAWYSTILSIKCQDIRDSLSCPAVDVVNQKGIEDGN